MITIDEKRLEKLPKVTLKSGGHDNFKQGACAMELVSWLAGERFSDHPECASLVIAAFMRNWNDSLRSDEDRTRLLLPLVPKLVGTRGSEALEHRRSLMAADWLVRTHTPAWLRLAGLTKQAESLEALPEITSMAQVPSIRGPLEAVRQDADDARDAAWAAAWAAATAAARDAARDAAWAAAGLVVRDLISTEHYDELTRVVRTTLGPIHPDDPAMTL